MRTSIGASPLKPLLLPFSAASSSISRLPLNPSSSSSSSSPLQCGSGVHSRSMVAIRSSMQGGSTQSAPFPATDSLTSWRKAETRLVSFARSRSAFAELQRLQEESESAVSLAYEKPLEIVLYPDPRLRAKNKRITVFDDKLRELAEEMFDVMYRTDGVGLSAPQVGVNVQLMVFNPEGEKGKGEEIVLVNPKIYKYGNKRYLYTEGCLSFPGIEADVERPATVRIEAQRLDGKKFSLNLKEFPARIFQHEYDHLQSTLYFERMTPEIVQTIFPALEKLEKEYEERTGSPAPERIRDRIGG